MTAKSGVRRNYFSKSFYISFFGYLILSSELAGRCLLTAQQYHTTFGRVAEYNIPYGSRYIVTGKFNPDGGTDIGIISDNRILSLTQRIDSFHSSRPILRIKEKIKGAATALLNRDDLEDFILVTENPSSLQVFLSNQKGRYYLSWIRSLVDEFENISLADINNDKKTDIILYGKKQLGATVYPGAGNGIFRQNMTLFSEYSLSAISVVDLNEDGIKDIVTLNWISNEILTFIGFGGMKFSDPIVINTAGTPELLEPASINLDNYTDIVVGYPAENKCEIYAGNGLGEFQMLQTVSLEHAPSHFAVGDANGDGRDDLLLVSGSAHSFMIKLNNGKGILEEGTQFYAGEGPSKFSLLKHPSAGRYDAAILDTTDNMIRILRNSTPDSLNSVGTDYGAGIKPAGVTAADVNHDGFPDIIAADPASRSFSLFINNKKGYLEGKISLNVPYSPAQLRYNRIDDTLGILIATNPDSNNLFIMEFNPVSYSYRTYTLPTDGHTDVLKISRDIVSRIIQIYSLNIEDRSKKASLLKYEKVGWNRFVEQSVHINTKGTVFINGIMANHNQAGNSLLFYLSFDPKQKKEYISYYKVSASGHLGFSGTIDSVDAYKPIPALLWSADLNDDNRNDIILYLGETENRLFSMMGKGDTEFSSLSPLSTIPVKIVSREKLKIRDINGDGIPDIIFENDFIKNINVCYGRNDGTFSSPARSASSHDTGGFTIADIDNDSQSELIKTIQSSGTIRIMPFQIK